MKFKLIEHDVQETVLAEGITLNEDINDGTVRLDSKIESGIDGSHIEAVILNPIEGTTSFVGHYIDGDPTVSEVNGNTNLALLPSGIHNKFRKDNVTEWNQIMSNYDTSNIETVNGRSFIIVLPKNEPDLEEPQLEI